jgi:hypothetical protein
VRQGRGQGRERDAALSCKGLLSGVRLLDYIVCILLRSGYGYESAIHHFVENDTLLVQLSHPCQWMARMRLDWRQLRRMSLRKSRLGCSLGRIRKLVGRMVQPPQLGISPPLPKFAPSPPHAAPRRNHSRHALLLRIDRPLPPLRLSTLRPIRIAPHPAAPRLPPYRSPRSRHSPRRALRAATYVHGCHRRRCRRRRY